MYPSLYLIFSRDKNFGIAIFGCGLTAKRMTVGKSIGNYGKVVQGYLTVPWLHIDHCKNYLMFEILIIHIIIKFKSMNAFEG